MNDINLTLNGKKVKGKKGETILQLARRNGIEIPTLCNDARLEPYSSCFVCVVEVKGMRGMQPSCSTKISEGMEVETNNNKVFKARKTALELLISNHYADCLSPCTQACPAGVDIQGYVALIEKRMYNEAIALIKETNPLPSICGRVCVRPCEAACRRNLLNEGKGVGIDYLKRFAADYDLNSETKYIPEIKKPTGKKIAIIGAGPGGLSSAFFLQIEGHHCDLYEANPKPGGWLRYGIPEYRLPNNILDKEINEITALGANIFCNKKFGENISYEELKKNYDAVILTIGSQKGTSIGCDGDDAKNIFSGIDFLRNMEITGKRADFSGKKIAVIGGGNTAMDCCRTAVRCGSEKTYIIYRRTEKEMPANPIEIHESKLEGVEYLFLTNPKNVNKDDNGVLKSLTCLKMKLAEPDASGRCRPLPIEDSEFDIELDYVLAAIGQKTDADFIDDINNNSKNNQLKLDKRGNISANPETFQTDIESIFAAGDGVTGPATIIEAIAQAKIASHSCNQYVMGLPVIPIHKEFISRKENFKQQIPEDYLGNFENQKREEMPTLPPDKRINFNEVELGYDNEEIAIHEAQRCFECGCSEYFTCNLKKYCSEYDVDQTKFAGSFNEYNVNFAHPFIEIDSNKCILCSLCIRTCSDIVGANALGLVNRGFDTFVAPNMENSLSQTNCESCGMCIDVCPTGAISENVTFKPGPLKLEKLNTICNYCSVGCSISVNHNNGFVMKVTGREGLINKDKSICRFPKFGYHYLNSQKRITKPLIKVNNEFKEISFNKAYQIIKNKINSVSPDENSFFAGARLSNEEMYLIQKFARAAVKTNNIDNFHYLDRGTGYFNNSLANANFDEIKQASKIYLIGSEINNDNAVVGFMINNAKIKNNIPVELITVNYNSSMKHKVNNVCQIKSYYHFIKAVNHYLVSKNLHNKMFINDLCENYETYKTSLLKENFDALVTASGVCCKDEIIEFAKDYNHQMNAIIVFSEKEISANASLELFNLSMITGKLGKTNSGLISLKEKNNSQGLIDMGINPKFGVGYHPISEQSLINKEKEIWNINELSSISFNQKELLENGKIKNLFIFGEDPIGCAFDNKTIVKLLSKTEFIMVSDNFMSETAQQADLILPASFPLETNGSFTNTQKFIQQFTKQIKAKVERTLLEQLSDLFNKFGFKQSSSAYDIMMETVSLFTDKKNNYKFIVTDKDNNNKMFDHACDYLTKNFIDGFNKTFEE
ncbi:MAG: molybdopterin-dependent oxidoreductase [Bacteroidetes bacterium]|nr:molybdopterin-dependent oxidoreductase [Bacteroidota bacterium]